MREITANDLKVKGISAIETGILEGNEVIITVRGRQKYVVMTIEEYNKLREYELEAAILETRRDIENGNFFEGTIQEHLKRLENV